MFDYNAANSFPRDSRVHFDEPSHSYFVDTQEGELACDSVTTVVDGCFEHFDAVKWAALKATPEKPAEVLLEEWSRKGEEARAAGTLMHDRIERFYLGAPIEKEASEDPAFRNFLTFAEERKLTPFRSEWRIFSEKYRLAGTLDFLAYDGEKFEIYDWKRSTKIFSPEGEVYTNSFGRFACEPLTHVPDTTFFHYALQVSLYRYILATEYGIRVEAGHLGTFHPAYDRPYVVNLPYMLDEVIALLNHRYENFAR